MEPTRDSSCFLFSVKKRFHDIFHGFAPVVCSHIFWGMCVYGAVDMAKNFGKSEIKVRSVPQGNHELVHKTDIKIVYLHKH